MDVPARKEGREAVDEGTDSRVGQGCSFVRNDETSLPDRAHGHEPIVSEIRRDIDQPFRHH